MKAVLATLALTLTSAFCAGQVVWSNTGGPEGTSRGFGGIFKALDGRWVANISESYTPTGYPTRFVLISENGELEFFPTWQHPDWYQGGYWVFPDTVEQRYLLRRGASSTNFLEYYGIAHLLANPDFEVEPFSLTAAPEGYTPYTGNLCQARNGDVVSAFSLRYPGQQNTPNRFIFQRHSLAGDSLTSLVYTIGSVAPLALDSTATGFAVLFRVAHGLGPTGPGKVLYFDEEFNYTGGFLLSSVNGEPYGPDVEGMPRLTDIKVQANGNMILAATTLIPDVFGYLYTPILLKYSPEGVLLDTLRGLVEPFYTEETTEHLHVAADGTLLWTFNEVTIDGPSRSHIWRVDEDLNAIRKFLVEGIPDSVNYYISEAVDYPNGDILVAGFVRPAGQLTGGSSYLARLSGSTTAVPDLPQRPRIQPHPNPGTTFQFSGMPAHPRALHLTVVDAQGRLVHVQPLSPPRLAVDAAVWPSGLYHYRVVDSAGEVLTTGKWIRE